VSTYLSFSYLTSELIGFFQIILRTLLPTPGLHEIGELHSSATFDTGGYAHCLNKIPVIWHGKAHVESLCSHVLSY
jgi:hypothetical protein